MPNARKHTQTHTRACARAARTHTHAHTHARLSEHIGAQIPEPVLHCTVNAQAQSSRHDEHVYADERSLELRRRVHLRKRTHLRACAHVVVRVRVCVRVCMSACACTLLTGKCSDVNSVRRALGSRRNMRVLRCSGNVPRCKCRGCCHRHNRSRCTRHRHLAD